MGKATDLHPVAPAGGGGPGAFSSPQPMGTNPALDKWRNPQPMGVDMSPLPIADEATIHTQKKDDTDAEIEALNLSKLAKKAAYRLKRKHPSVVFTSGRRDKAEQASAMASNVVLNRKWIHQTYARSVASDSCQKWVNENPDKTTKAAIAEGLKEVLDSLSDRELGLLSMHLSGAAFDVKPVEEDATAIKKTIRSLPGLTLFLEKEGGLVRWHAQF